MFLLAQILLVAAIAIAVVHLFFKEEETPTLFKTLIPAKEEIAEEYLKVKRSNSSILRPFSLINRPLMPPQLRDRINSDLAIAKIRFSAEEFLLIRKP